ncbi:unnamed protein product [Linum trigynum]|uniref:Uncharacterized protein n=1 Tax=Linum trigynum TaxID=586398 RepID=A0AAV2FS27_9ROSI
MSILKSSLPQSSAIQAFLHSPPLDSSEFCLSQFDINRAGRSYYNGGARDTIRARAPASIDRNGVATEGMMRTTSMLDEEGGIDSIMRNLIVVSNERESVN